MAGGRLGPRARSQPGFIQLGMIPLQVAQSSCHAFVKRILFTRLKLRKQLYSIMYSSPKLCKHFR